MEQNTNISKAAHPPGTSDSETRDGFAHDQEQHPPGHQAVVMTDLPGNEANLTDSPPSDAPPTDELPPASQVSSDALPNPDENDDDLEFSHIQMLRLIERSDKPITNAPFKDSGRSYHEPNIESALIGLLVHKPSLINWAAKELAPGDFFVPAHHQIFESMLRLHNASKTVNKDSILDDLCITHGQSGVDLVADMNTAIRSGFDFKYRSVYVRRMKEAASVRGGNDYCPHFYSEHFSAQLLLARLPNVRCSGQDWYQYHDGLWMKSNIRAFGRDALSVIHPKHSGSRRADDVLQHFSKLRNWPADHLRSGYRFDDNGDVLVNAANKVIRIDSTGKITAIDHSPDYCFTGKLNCAWNPTATCDLFRKKIAEMLPDPLDQLVLQTFCGYILYPSCKFETALVAYGPGGTGKSTMAMVIADILGPGLVCNAGLEELCKSGSYTLPTLKHKLLNLGSELRGTEAVESANFKKLVSGEAMNVRQIYQSPEDIQTSCKLMFLSNNPPRFQMGTDAEARRLRILAFTHKPVTPDVDLKRKLSAEREGVFNWMLEGLSLLIKQGAIPQGGNKSAAVMKSFGKSNDPVGSFVAERCIIGSGRQSIKSDVLHDFEVWCSSNGFEAERFGAVFWRILYSRHPEVSTDRQTINGERTYIVLGLSLKNPPEPGDTPSASEDKPTSSFKPSKLFTKPASKVRPSISIIERLKKSREEQSDN